MPCLSRCDVTPLLSSLAVAAPSSLLAHPLLILHVFLFFSFSCFHVCFSFFLSFFGWLDFSQRFASRFFSEWNSSRCQLNSPLGPFHHPRLPLKVILPNVLQYSLESHLTPGTGLPLCVFRSTCLPVRWSGVHRSLQLHLHHCGGQVRWPQDAQHALLCNKWAASITSKHVYLGQ